MGLFGRIGAGNLGNDASLEAVLRYLRRDHPEAVLDAMFTGPEPVGERYGLPVVRLNWLRPAGRSRSRLLHVLLTVLRIGVGAIADAIWIGAWVRGHDVVILPGMGLFETDLAQRPWEFPYSLFLVSVAGKLFGTKTAYVSVGATVVEQPVTGRLLRIACRLADYRSFRDQPSLDAARRMGMAGADDPTYPDLVFALPVPPARPEPTGVVAVGVMAYDGTPADRNRADEVRAAYVRKMTQLVRALIDDGHRVRLMIGDFNDEPVVREIIADARARWTGPGEPPVIFEALSTIHDVMDQLSQADVVVGTRFHTVLVALMLGKPTVAIAYGRKHTELMNQLGVGAWVQQIAELDADLLEKQVAALQADREQITRTLAEHAAANRDQLNHQFTRLSTQLLDAPRETAAGNPSRGNPPQGWLS
ncbi:polysaccharide pyruvyl transferase WcaK-like protein [Kribbella aluminosa]|uniref:Polysaccharide pyruvyl transferase WcaK-like protein n=1 Tax=Kribbella aluminosa TaxID=416017 RepID=A0ABS4UZ15_9ACTN|nr:polysaccharide pyruvyl transferase family protein [Kribbella aluminosa]MBP2356900.1 polysaccharide pyruvyl transferase WcaK-like protein [Kribbella aluminosa]